MVSGGFKLLNPGMKNENNITVFSRQVCVKFRTFQGLLKVSFVVFKDYKLMKYTYSHIKILLPKYWTEISRKKC